MGEEEGGERALERTEGLMKDDKNVANVESFAIPESGALVDLQINNPQTVLSVTCFWR